MNQKTRFFYNDIEVIPASKLGDKAPMIWTVDQIWPESGTGILGGEPKIGKSWFMLQMAVCISLGIPFLNKFKTDQGKVLIYSPEGGRKNLNNRLKIAQEFYKVEKLENVNVIEKREMRLNVENDQQSLEAMIKCQKPKLIVFDTLKRCFRGDENSSKDIGDITTFLNLMARLYGCSIMVLHHISKSIGRNMYAGIRGSGELRGFGDVNLGLGEHKGKLFFEAELRNGAKLNPVPLEKNESGLWVLGSLDVKDGEPKKLELGDKILDLLVESSRPLNQREIRKILKGDTSKYGPALRELVRSGDIAEERAGKAFFYSLPQASVEATTENTEEKENDG
jgi:hypothetical protein